MGYASRSGRAFTSDTNPRAFAVCNRCGQWWNRDQLNNQMEWRGASLLPTYVFVCPPCLDVPQQQLRAIVVPADPVPVKMPFVEPFAYDETTDMSLAPPTFDSVTGIPIINTTAMVTTTGVNMTPAPIGDPVGLQQAGIAPLQVVAGVPTHFGNPLPILSLSSNGTDQITATFSAPHGLSTDSQISVEGAGSPAVSLTLEANGFFSVTVTTATALTYQVNRILPAQALLNSTTRIVQCLVGLPYGYTQIPLTGG